MPPEIYFCPTCPEGHQLKNKDEMFDNEICRECAVCFEDGKGFEPPEANNNWIANPI